jgi:hypothetical protein
MFAVRGRTILQRKIDITKNKKYRVSAQFSCFHVCRPHNKSEKEGKEGRKEGRKEPDRRNRIILIYSGKGKIIIIEKDRNR